MRAYKNSDPYLVAVYSKRGAMLRGVRASGAIVARRNGRHAKLGDIATGLTPRDVFTSWSNRFADKLDVRVALECGEPEASEPIITAAKAAKRDAARARRAAAAEAKREADRIRERDALGDLSAGDPMLPLRADDAALDTYAALARAKFPAQDPRLAYVIRAARFHGGASSPWLGNLIGADIGLPREYPYKAQLEEIADAVATRAFGSNLRAAAVWHRALGG